ncbi:uncharacterized protein K02A2.6-like [Arachis ipaensis]|uniref:uncharacterized protein K02A2.6-like n=1 Tax=Arachis ipaensis TaxID=130454 RepID=UPI0007AF138A|nr:uncharacterized protein K02A2.6-like [Arachis ipaensis]XP_025636494.1 uncharacterized protein K02A2.6-like [Arachis hypogaea]
MADRSLGTWGIDLVGPFSHRSRKTPINHRRHQLLPQVDRSRTLSFHYGNPMPKVLMETRGNPVRYPKVVISDNGTQFMDKRFREFLEGLHISHNFSLVEHPQTSGQVESANKIIVKGLKKRLDEAKGLWADELGSVLWSYRTTPQTSTGETPFWLTYGLEAIIPVEVGDFSPRRTVGSNDEDAERDFMDEVRSITHLRELALKQRIGLRYNRSVIRREFGPDDLILG